MMNKIYLTADEMKQIADTDAKIKAWRDYLREHYNDSDIVQRYNDFILTLDVDDDLWYEHYVDAVEWGTNDVDDIIEDFYGELEKLDIEDTYCFTAVELHSLNDEILVLAK